MGKQKNNQYIILLHGMGRTWRSMWWMSRAFKQAGYHVRNIGYPSTHHNIQWLADKHISPVVQRLANSECIHFVTHSLGGILVRQYLQAHALPEGSRIVMLAPPNHGSEVTDKLFRWKPYQWLNGPAGQQLGTSDNSIPNQLKPISIDTGIITGDKSTNPLFSSWIPGKDDGKVSVNSARLDEMKDFLVVPTGHTFIMNNANVIRQTLYFLDNGYFKHAK